MKFNNTVIKFINVLLGVHNLCYQLKNTLSPLQKRAFRCPKDPISSAHIEISMLLLVLFFENFANNWKEKVQNPDSFTGRIAVFGVLITCVINQKHVVTSTKTGIPRSKRSHMSAHMKSEIKTSKCQRLKHRVIIAQNVHNYHEGCKRS